MLFIHAHLMTMEPTPTGFLTIEDGFLLTQDGRIQNLGPMSQCPALSDFPAQEVYDLEGKSVYPGFIDAHCHMGLAEERLNFEGDDLNEMTDPVTRTCAASTPSTRSTRAFPRRWMPPSPP